MLPASLDCQFGFSVYLIWYKRLYKITLSRMPMITWRKTTTNQSICMMMLYNFELTQLYEKKKLQYIFLGNENISLVTMRVLYTKQELLIHLEQWVLYEAGTAYPSRAAGFTPGFFVWLCFLFFFCTVSWVQCIVYCTVTPQPNICQFCLWGDS
jgi:hypothetical protein